MGSNRVPASLLAKERRERQKYEAALRAIIALDAHDDSEGWNEWGESNCFHKVQKLAQEALDV